MSEQKKTVVIGATPNPARFAYRAVKSLLSHNQPVVPVGIKKGEIDGLRIRDYSEPVEDVHTVTLYLNPQNQKQHYDYILGLNPKRIIFNPGTENPELQKMAEERGIEAKYACTLIMLNIGSY